MIYFIQEESNLIGAGLVKIGRSKNPARRIRQLERQRGCRLYFLFVEMPTISESRAEQEYHERFSEVRIKGTEWFEPREPLLTYLESGHPAWRPWNPEPRRIDERRIRQEISDWLEEFPAGVASG